jgi:hypothetical protein
VRFVSPTISYNCFRAIAKQIVKKSRLSADRRGGKEAREVHLPVGSQNAETGKRPQFGLNTQ